MNTLTQLELLLNQLYNSSVEISKFIENEELEGLSDSIRVKDRLLEKIEQVKMTSSDWDLSSFADLLEKINCLELGNLKHLEILRNNTHSEFQAQTRTSKLLKTYEPQKHISGKILDMSE